MRDLWDESRAAGMSEPERLLYRSNLLGSDLRITNFGGGNTSAKIEAEDPLTGDPVTVLWVKGSGGDLGSMGLDGFATLYLDRLRALESRYRGLAHEDEMVAYLPHCVFDANPRAASIDTSLHAYLPWRHVDHVHPDAIIAIAATERSEALTGEAFDGEVGWLPWQRPGFDLGLRLRDLARTEPDLRGVVLAGHGLFTWGPTSLDCYRNTLAVIARAEAWLEERASGGPVFGGLRLEARAADERRRNAARLMPPLRGALSGVEPKVGHFRDDPDVLEFVCSAGLETLAGLGTSCPDHFLRTKIRPLVLPIDAEPTGDALAEHVTAYRRAYEAYYERCRHPGSPAMRDPSPVIVLLPGTGLVAYARDKATARIAAEFYVNAIHVMRGATSVDRYTGLAEQEAFDIEYWSLEEAKLRRQPPPRDLAGRVALVTGGAGGIGRAVAERLLRDDAHVALLDRDAAALDSAREALEEAFSADRVRAVACDVTDEASVVDAFERVSVEFGGVDVVVSNAGIASAAPIEETTMEVWSRNQDVLSTGYFLVAREAARVLRTQGRGGSIVFIGSKNALAASPGAAAYSVAKAAELHLARSLALELAPLGVRVNSVNPDAVLRGSRMWSSSWRADRAAAHGIRESELEAHYRDRSLLKRSVFPEDVAEAVHFFATERSAKSTGNILNVDAGNATAFTR
jgi:rhamnulose-1-phosphate aldolase/alcohol dehydrogenase